MLIVLLSQDAISQSKEQLVRHKIYRVDGKTVSGDWILNSSTYYNVFGDQVLAITYDSSYKFINLSQYSDSLLVKTISIKYQNNVLVDSLVHIFEYTFDSSGTMTQNRLLYPDGTMRINRMKYNSDQKMDTLFEYRSESKNSDSVLIRKMVYTYWKDKSVRYGYDYQKSGSNKVEICESYETDTLRKYKFKDCVIVNDQPDSCTSYNMYITYDGDQITKYVNEKYSSRYENEYIRNEKGLVVKKINRSINKGKLSEQISLITYYYRQ